MKKIIIILGILIFIGSFTGIGFFSANALEWYEEGESEQSSVLAKSPEPSEPAPAASPEPPSLSSLSLSAKFLDHDILKISTLAENFETPVLGLAFHLKFDFNKITFLKYEPGDFLELGGDPFYIVQNKTDQNKAELGTIYFGSTLRRSDRFPVGSGTVVEFYFQEISPNDAENTKYEFKFENGSVSTLDATRQDIDKVDFKDAIFDKNDPPIAQTEQKNDSSLASVLNSDEGFLSKNLVWIVTVSGVLTIFLILYFYFRKA